MIDNQVMKGKWSFLFEIVLSHPKQQSEMSPNALYQLQRQKNDKKITIHNSVINNQVMKGKWSFLFEIVLSHP